MTQFDSTDPRSDLTSGSACMSPDEHQSLAHLYGVLGQLWLQEVDAKLLHSLQESTFAESLGIAVGQDGSNQSIEDLAVDYCALFIGPKEHLPPYQSVWQTGQLQSDTSASVRAFDDALSGSTLIAENAMADHLGYQLRLMSELYRQLSATTDSTTKASLLEMQSAFFASHLCWTSSLLRRASQKATTELYRKVMRLTQELLTSEAESTAADVPA